MVGCSIPIEQQDRESERSQNPKIKESKNPKVKSFSHLRNLVPKNLDCVIFGILDLCVLEILDFRISGFFSILCLLCFASGIHVQFLMCQRLSRIFDSPRNLSLLIPSVNTKISTTTPSTITKTVQINFGLITNCYLYLAFLIKGLVIL